MMELETSVFQWLSKELHYHPGTYFVTMPSFLNSLYFCFSISVERIIKSNYFIELF